MKLNQILETENASVSRPGIGPMEAARISWRIVLAIPVGSFLAMALHRAISGKEPAIETRVYFIFLAVILSAGGGSGFAAIFLEDLPASLPAMGSGEHTAAHHPP